MQFDGSAMAIIVIVCITLLFAWGNYWDYRKRRLEVDDRRRMIENGMRPPDPMTPSLAGWAGVKQQELQLKYAERRLRKHFYDRWVIAPMRVHKESKMPAFADQEGKTSIREIYDGDARKQYDAIWHYLLEGEGIRPPEN